MRKTGSATFNIVPGSRGRKDARLSCRWSPTRLEMRLGIGNGGQEGMGRWSADSQAVEASEF